MIKGIKKEVGNVQIGQVIKQKQRHEQPNPSLGIVREPPMLNFDPEQKVAFTIWRRKWNSWYYMVTRKGSLDNDQIFHSLMNCFSERTMEYFLNLGLDSQQEKEPELIIERLSGLVSSGNNHNIHRQEFQMRIQNPDETFDSWMAALKELADQAHFDLDCCGKCKDARLLQQVIYGLAKLETRNMLMNIGTGLTLEQATRVIKTTECDQNNNAMTSYVQNNFLEPMTPFIVPLTDGRWNQTPPIVFQDMNDFSQINVTSPDDKDLIFLNPYHLNTPTAWTKSFGAETMDQETGAPELVQGSTNNLKKRRLKLPFNEKEPNNQELAETKNTLAEKQTNEKVSKSKVINDPILKTKLAKSKKQKPKLQAKSPQSKKDVCNEPKEKASKFPQKVQSSKKDVSKEHKKRHVGPTQETSMESLGTDNVVFHGNLSTSIEHENKNTSHEVANTIAIKNEPAEQFQCQFCNKNFSLFYFLKKHKCETTQRSNNMDLNISFCVNCEMSFANSNLNEEGRCFLCQDSCEGQKQEEINRQKISIQQIKTEPNSAREKHPDNNGLAFEFCSVQMEEEFNEELNNNFNKDPNENCNQEPYQDANNNDVPNEPIHNNKDSQDEVSEEQLEGLILEAIEELRKIKKTSNEIAIAKKIIVKDKRFTNDMIWAQIEKCVEDGLIEKLKKKNSKSYRLACPLRMKVLTTHNIKM